MAPSQVPFRPERPRTGSGARSPSIEACGTVASLPRTDGRFARAMRRIATGVSVVATLHNGRSLGVLTRGFLVASKQPPTLLVSVPGEDAAASAMHAAGVFCVNVLATGDAKVAQAFAPSSSDDPFAGARWNSLVTGAPALEDCLVSLDCRVREVFEGMGFLVFAGEVLATELWQGERAPLIHHDETFIRL